MGKPVTVEAMQFNGLDDYLEILDWMKVSGDTSALADEVRYSTPEMTIRAKDGQKSARPGDWIVKGLQEGFFEVLRH